MKNILDYYNKGVSLLDKTPVAKPRLKTTVDENITLLVIKEKIKLIESFTDVIGVTLTLKKKFHDSDDSWLHREIQCKLIKSNTFKKLKYILVPEYTKNGNLHYHGIIWDSYQLQYMKAIKWWRRNYGFVKPELKINNYANWTNYMFKDYYKTGLYILYKF